MEPATGEPVRKVFFALKPPANVVERVAYLAARWQRRFGAPAPLVPAERLHVSLNWLGAYRRLPQGDLQRAADAVSRLSLRPFALAFNRLGGWGRGDGTRPVVLWGDDGVIGAEMLHATLHVALSEVGMASPGRREFAAHLTLWRSAAATPEVAVPPVGWRADELLLLASVQGEGRHEVLGRWRLGG